MSTDRIQVIMTGMEGQANAFRLTTSPVDHLRDLRQRLDPLRSEGLIVRTGSPLEVRVNVPVGHQLSAMLSNFAEIVPVNEP